MLDLLIRGARIVDGTGAPSFTGDVGVRDGRVVAVGTRRRSRAGAPSTPTVSSSRPGSSTSTRTTTRRRCGTPALTPSPLHGVTTVIGGNCGFSIAPLEPEHVDYVMRMMARVEGMPLGVARGRPDMGLALLRRVARPPRRPPGGERRVPRGPLDHAPRRDGRRRHARRRERRADRGDGRGCCTSRWRPARSASRRRSARRTPTATARRCRRAPRNPTSSSPSPAPCATTRAPPSSSSPPWARSPTTASSS